MKTVLLSLVLTIASLSGYSQVFYKATTGTAIFFSDAPLEDITATSKNMISVINATTKKVAFSVPMSSFQFDNKLMQEHFNEKYMETGKYPKATFEGVINEPVDITKPGVYNVTATGNLTIHGVSQPRTISGTLTVTKESVTLFSNFSVKLVDHKITVPEVVFKNIAEVIDVKVTIDYSVSQK